MSVRSPAPATEEMDTPTTTSGSASLFQGLKLGRAAQGFRRFNWSESVYKLNSPPHTHRQFLGQMKKGYQKKRNIFKIIGEKEKNS